MFKGLSVCLSECLCVCTSDSPAHTTNPVPFIVVEGEGRKIPGHGGAVQLRETGRLADVAPTILEILNIPKPAEMTGESLIAKAEADVKTNRTPVNLTR